MTLRNLWCMACGKWTAQDPTRDEVACTECGDAYACQDCGFEIDRRGVCQRRAADAGACDQARED